MHVISVYCNRDRPLAENQSKFHNIKSTVPAERRSNPLVIPNAFISAFPSQVLGDINAAVQPNFKDRNILQQVTDCHKLQAFNSIAHSEAQESTLHPKPSLTSHISPLRLGEPGMVIFLSLQLHSQLPHPYSILYMSIPLQQP